MDDRVSQLFYELHDGLPQQGPGSRASTERAWNIAARTAPVSGSPSANVENPAPLRILDVGCGPGRQTLDLLDLTEGIEAQITAVDNYQPFLDQLVDAATSRGPDPSTRRSWSRRLSAVNANMADLPFEDAGFDIVWSEGAIYIIGFEAGLSRWRRLLRPGGVIAVTEISWLHADPPEEAKAFWAAEYPAMQSIDENLETLEGAGYRVLGHFVLPEADWWEGYYDALNENARRFEEKYRGDETAAEVLSMERQEMAIYSRHADSYSYVFYIATCE